MPTQPDSQKLRERGEVARRESQQMRNDAKRLKDDLQRTCGESLRLHEWVIPTSKVAPPPPAS